MKRIGNQAFYYCYLTSVSLGSGIAFIGDAAFAYDDALPSITFRGTRAAWNKIGKGTDWNTGSAIASIVCTDGTVSP